MLKKTIFLALAFFASGTIVADQETSPTTIGALKSIEFAIHPDKALGQAANDPENTLFLRYGRPGSESYNKAHLRFYFGYTLGAAVQAAIGFLIANNLYHTAVHQTDILNKVSERFPEGHPKLTRFITAFLAWVLNVSTFYTNKIEPAYNGYYIKDEQVLSEMLPISLVPMSAGYLVTNAALRLWQSSIDKDPFNKMVRPLEYLAAATAAFTLYLYAESGPNIDRYPHESNNDSDMTEVMLGGLWFWLLLTHNKYITGAFGKVAQLTPGHLSSEGLRNGLAAATVLARSAYAGFDIGDLTAMGIGGLLAWGLATKDPKIAFALASLIATWSALGAAANTLVLGYSQTNTIN